MTEDLQKRVLELETQLELERSKHAEEVAALNAEITLLRGELRQEKKKLENVLDAMDSGAFL
jgi:capsule polysaccharide export protein KpsE/RkpR